MTKPFKLKYTDGRKASPTKMFGNIAGRSAKDLMGIVDLSDDEEEIGGGKDTISKKIDKKVDQKVEEVVNQETGEGLV